MLTQLLLVAALSAQSPAAPAPVQIPADGKYDKLKVEGVTVPLINIMESGSVVLVDTDGRKPRTWEVQYKRVGDLPPGWFDTRKKDLNNDNNFKDDPVDAQGLWKMDEKGNITRE